MPDPLAELAAALGDLTRVDTTENDRAVPPGQRPCPICGEAMRFESQGPVHIDVCDHHGMWLDHGELPALLSHARGQSTRSVNRRVARARRDGKVTGVLLGAWSLLLD